MTYHIEITPHAEQDIWEAANYIEYSLKNPLAADALLARVAEEIATLSDFPERIKLVSDPVLSAWGIRFLTIQNYLAFFVIDQNKQTVTIVRFLHNRRNWVNILKSGI